MDLALARRSPASRWSLGGGVAGFGLLPATHIGAQSELIARRRCGMIAIENKQLIAIYGRWWPYLGSLLQVFIDTNLRLVKHDYCELYYHVALSSPAYLTLSYIRSGPRTSVSTIYAATLVADEIARLKRSSGIVCNVTNDRVSQRLLERWKWERHCLDWPGRHYIKRFYGRYPSIGNGWRERLTMELLEANQ